MAGHLFCNSGHISCLVFYNAPIYPKELLKKGIEGYCILEFSVTKEGTTEDIKVVDCTNYDFANSSIEAAKKFKYIPETVNGDPRPTVGVLQKMTFKLESSQKQSTKTARSQSSKSSNNPAYDACMTLVGEEEKELRTQNTICTIALFNKKYKGISGWR